MTVQELINKLNKISNKDAMVVMKSDRDGCFDPVLWLTEAELCPGIVGIDYYNIDFDDVYNSKKPEPVVLLV